MLADRVRIADEMINGKRKYAEGVNTTSWSSPLVIRGLDFSPNLVVAYIIEPQGNYITLAEILVKDENIYVTDKQCSSISIIEEQSSLRVIGKRQSDNDSPVFYNDGFALGTILVGQQTYLWKAYE